MIQNKHKYYLAIISVLIIIIINNGLSYAEYADNNLRLQYHGYYGEWYPLEWNIGLKPSIIRASGCAEGYFKLVRYYYQNDEGKRLIKCKSIDKETAADGYLVIVDNGYERGVVTQECSISNILEEMPNIVSLCIFAQLNVKEAAYVAKFSMLRYLYVDSVSSQDVIDIADVQRLDYFEAGCGMVEFTRMPFIFTKEICYINCARSYLESNNMKVTDKYVIRYSCELEFKRLIDRLPMSLRYLHVMNVNAAESKSIFEVLLTKSVEVLFVEYIGSGSDEIDISIAGSVRIIGIVSSERRLKINSLMTGSRVEILSIKRITISCDAISMTGANALIISESNVIGMSGVIAVRRLAKVIVLEGDIYIEAYQHIFRVAECIYMLNSNYRFAEPVKSVKRLVIVTYKSAISDGIGEYMSVFPEISCITIVTPYVERNASYKMSDRVKIIVFAAGSSGAKNIIAFEATNASLFIIAIARRGVCEIAEFDIE